MSYTNKIYSLLLIVALAFNVACEDSEETAASDAEAGTMTNGGNAVAGTDTAGTDTAGTDTAGTDTAGTDTAGTDTAGTDTAGTDTAGTDTAGTDTAGTDTAGTDTAGTDAGTIMPTGDTDALGCEGDYCPSARLNSLVIPMTPEDATANGCNLQGLKNGSSLGSLLSAIPGDINPNEFVQPDDENGEISLILLSVLAGWEAGKTGNDAGELDAQIFTGDADGDSYVISASSFNEDGTPKINFPGSTVQDGILATPPGDFLIDIPILEGLPLRLSLSQTEMVGNLALDEVGFSLSNGVLGGYLTRDAIVELVDTIGSACDGDNPPADICDALAGFGGAAGILPLLEGIAPYDSAVTADGAQTCSALGAPDCNALSVCLLITMESANISGQE